MGEREREREREEEGRRKREGGGGGVVNPKIAYTLYLSSLKSGIYTFSVL